MPMDVCSEAVHQYKLPQTLTLNQYKLPLTLTLKTINKKIQELYNVSVTQATFLALAYDKPPVVVVQETIETFSKDSSVDNSSYTIDTKNQILSRNPT